MTSRKPTVPTKSSQHTVSVVPMAEARDSTVGFFCTLINSRVYTAEAGLLPF